MYIGNKYIVVNILLTFMVSHIFGLVLKIIHLFIKTRQSLIEQTVVGVNYIVRVCFSQVCGVSFLNMCLFIAYVWECKN